MLLEKKQKEIEKYYYRGRKKDRSVIYLSQAYAQVGARQLPSIRKNTNYVALFRLQEERTISQIRSAYTSMVWIKRKSR